jgi:hypothetical protein
MIDLHIELDASQLERFLATAPRVIFNARRSAIRTTTTFADKELKRRMALATGLPGKVFKNFRVQKKSFDDEGRVWLGMNPVKAKYAGKLTEVGTGATAGAYYFEGGFIAKMHTGHESIFKRVGADRFPIIEQKIELPMARAILEQVAGLSQLELQRRYLEKLEAGLR